MLSNDLLRFLRLQLQCRKFGVKYQNPLKAEFKIFSSPQTITSACFIYISSYRDRQTLFKNSYNMNFYFLSVLVLLFKILLKISSLYVLSENALCFLVSMHCETELIVMPLLYCTYAQMEFFKFFNLSFPCVTIV